MAGLLRNKVIVVTGSSSGIGRAISVQCAQQGATLAIHHLGDPKSQLDAESLRDELSHAGPAKLNGQKVSHLLVGADLTNDGAPSSLISQTISAFGRIDVLVNNAGIARFVPAASVTKSTLTEHMDVNFMSAYLLTQAATARMAQQGHGGSIVSIASITALLGSSNLTHYGPTKAALIAMSRSYAVEYGNQGIRYNCVLPGTIETAMNQEHLAASGKKEYMESRVPVRRLGNPEDVAGVVVFFASDLSRYITGEQVLVDGGSAVYYE